MRCTPAVPRVAILTSTSSCDMCGLLQHIEYLKMGATRHYGHGYIPAGKHHWTSVLLLWFMIRMNYHTVVWHGVSYTSSHPLHAGTVALWHRVMSASYCVKHPGHAWLHNTYDLINCTSVTYNNRQRTTDNSSLILASSKLYLLQKNVDNIFKCCFLAVHIMTANNLGK